MNKLLQWRKFIFRICLSCFFIAVIFIYPTFVNSPGLAQSDLNLRSDIISLQARISRLEQEVSQLRGSLNKPNSRPARTERSTPTPTIINPPVVNGEAIGSSDPLYERLATLVIELKEDVRNIEQRLSEVEGQTAP